MADTLESLEIEVKYKASGAAAAIKSTTSAIKSLSNETKRAKSPLENFVASLKRIAFYRILRGIIKAITQAFQEGLQNAYAFSQGINTEGHRFAEAMDAMKSSTTQMKNQLGSAFISLLSAIAPIIIQIVNLVTKLADALAQLFAAFTGKTYLKAANVADKFANTMKAGGAAAKEWKNQLMGFDEINRLNEPNQGGGGGGSPAIDPSSMFEDSPIAEKWLKIAEKIKRVIQWIQDHMETIKTIALGIGAALLTWKLANFVSNLLGLNLPLSKILGFAIAIGGAFVFIKGACDAWKNGVNWDNITLMILGVSAAATGLALAFGHVGAAIALLVGGVAMCVVAWHEWIQTGELSAQTATLLSAGILAIGGGIALLTGSWIPLLIAGIVAIIVNGDNLKKKLGEWKEKFADTWGNGKLEIWDFAYAAISAIQGVIWVVQELWGWVVSAINAFINLKEVQAINNGGGSVSTWNGTIERPRAYASGGFPDEGQLFFANENGAELVGTMGGRTAVANQQEITEGIRQAVYDAMVASNANGNNDVSVRVYLDSREIKAGQQRLNRAWGVG